MPMSETIAGGAYVQTVFVGMYAPQRTEPQTLSK